MTTDQVNRRTVSRHRRGIKAPGGGYDPFVEPALEWRASTMQACGLYPFAVVGNPRWSVSRWAATC